ncbi:MAG: hypothetical protein OEU92_12255 [Alphaproteobacteria bacterium]|nr:hypothetical protein [Alphaproteobacteria bacterium]
MSAATARRLSDDEWQDRVESVSKRVIRGYARIWVTGDQAATLVDCSMALVEAGADLDLKESSLKNGQCTETVCLSVSIKYPFMRSEP